MNAQQTELRNLGTSLISNTHVADHIELQSRNEWVCDDNDYSENVLKWIRLYQGQDIEIVPTVYIQEDGSCSCKLKKNCPKPGKHPAPKQWTTDYTSKNKRPEEIRWDDKQGVGIRTGRENSLLVMDCDSEASYCRFIERFPEAKRTKTSRTFRGYQFYFRLPEGMTIRGGTDVLNHIGIPDVDSRGEGNFVMAPPTRHPKGGRYEWLNNEKVADVPAELLDTLKQNEKRSAESKAKGREIAHHVSSVLYDSKIEIGVRHDTFLSLAKRYRSLGLEEDEVIELLFSIPYENSEEEPFTQEEIVAIIDWTFNKINVEDNQRELLEVLLALYSYYSRKRWKGTGDYTDRATIIALIQQGLVFGEQRGGNVDVPISERTLAAKIGTTRKTAKNSLSRLKGKESICNSRKMEGSHCKTYRLLTKPIDEGIYTELPQVESKRKKGIFIPNISLPGIPVYKSLDGLLSEFIDFRWGKDKFGKTNATHLSILLSHSVDTGKRIYSNQEVADILSEYYGPKLKTTDLPRFFKKCIDPKIGILKRIEKGKYEIPEDIYERIEGYKENSGEYLAAEEQSATFEEDRRQYRLREKLWSAGLHYAFAGEHLRYKLLTEDGQYQGQCSDKMRELLVRALVNGEHVYKEAKAAWPKHAQNRLKAFMKDSSCDSYDAEYEEAIMEHFEESYE